MNTERDRTSLEPASFLDLIAFFEREHLNNALKDAATVEVIFRLHEYEEKVRNGHFVFSTDSYDENSTKGRGCLRCGVSQKLIVYDPATRKPADMKVLIQNDNNKVQLCEVLVRISNSEEAASTL